MSRRNYGTGSITWLGPSKALLRVSSPTGRRSKTIRTKHREHGGRRQASEELERFQAEVEREGNGRAVTLGQAFDDYLAHCERLGRKPTTVDSYRSVQKRLSPELSASRIDLLTSHDLDQFYGTMQQGPTTIRQTHSVLVAVLNQAVRWEWIETNPAMRATPPSAPRRRRKDLDLVDVSRLVDHAAIREPVIAMAIALGVLTGARRGELCGLRWEDWDEDRRSIRLERQWIPKPGGGQYLGDLKHSPDGRTIYLGEMGAALIRRFREQQSDLLHREPEGWLLSYDAGSTPMTAKSLGNSITQLGKEIGLRVTTHSLRHVQMTQLIAAGVDVETAAGRGGHSVPIMLSTYVHGAEDRAIAAADTIEARLVAQGLPLGEILGHEKTPAEAGVNPE